MVIFQIILTSSHPFKASSYRSSDVSKVGRTRLAVIQEIIFTEEAYVNSLQHVINVRFFFVRFALSSLRLPLSWCLNTSCVFLPDIWCLNIFSVLLSETSCDCVWLIYDWYSRSTLSPSVKPRALPRRPLRPSRAPISIPSSRTWRRCTLWIGHFALASN